MSLDFNLLNVYTCGSNENRLPFTNLNVFTK